MYKRKQYLSKLLYQIEYMFFKSFEMKYKFSNTIEDYHIYCGEYNNIQYIL